METPQAFRFEILRRAYRATESQALEVTDDVSAAEAIGVPTRLVENLLSNLKVTLPQDLALAEAILKTREG